MFHHQADLNEHLAFVTEYNQFFVFTMCLFISALMNIVGQNDAICWSLNTYMPFRPQHHVQVEDSYWRKNTRKEPGVLWDLFDYWLEKLEEE